MKSTTSKTDRERSVIQKRPEVCLLDAPKKSLLFLDVFTFQNTLKAIWFV